MILEKSNMWDVYGSFGNMIKQYGNWSTKRMTFGEVLASMLETLPPEVLEQKVVATPRLKDEVASATIKILYCPPNPDGVLHLLDKEFTAWKITYEDGTSAE